MEKVNDKEIELKLNGNGLRTKMDNLKKRKPIWALILSLLTPGLGQIYNGQFKKGISYSVGVYLVYMLFSFLLLKFHRMIFYPMVTMGFFFFIVIDAFRGAHKLKAMGVGKF